MDLGDELRENILACFLINVLGLIIFWFLLLLIKTGIHLVKCIFCVYLFKSSTFSFGLDTYNKITEAIKGIRCDIFGITLTIVNLSGFGPSPPAILRSWLDDLPRCLNYNLLTLPLCLVFICVKRAG